MLAMRRSASIAAFPACMSAESSTYHVLSTGTGPFGGAGINTDCVLASAATAMTMSAISYRDPRKRALNGALASTMQLFVHPSSPIHQEVAGESSRRCHSGFCRVQVDVLQHFVVAH